MFIKEDIVCECLSEYLDIPNFLVDDFKHNITDHRQYSNVAILNVPTMVERRLK